MCWRWIFVAIAGALAGGCAAHPGAAAARPHPSTQLATKEATDAAIPASATASALVFRSPIASTVPAPDLSRDLRVPSAFIGYEEPIIETYHVYTDDRQVSGGYLGSCSPFACSPGGGFGYGSSLDRYERRAITEKVGVLHR